MNTLRITLNGKPHTLPAPATLADLLAACGQPAGAVGTAVNNRFVPRALRDKHLLQDGDAVFTFAPITGG